MSVAKRRSAEALVAASCALAVVAGGVYPAWSRVHAVEGYGDYVELGATLSGVPLELVAGTPFAFTATIDNGGPDTADYPALVVSADIGLAVGGSAGCLESPSLAGLCSLPAPLAAGEAASVSLWGVADPDARGVRVVGVGAVSEAIETAPGDELAFAAIPIVAQTDLVAGLLSEAPEVLGDGRLRWFVAFSNDGPSSVVPFVALGSYVIGPGAAEHACAASGAARCPDDPQGAYLRPGGALTYAVTLPPLGPDVPEVGVNLAIWPLDAAETGPLPNHVLLVYTELLFADDFD